MSYKSILGIIGCLMFLSGSVYAGLKYQQQFLQQTLSESVAQVQQQLDAKWAQIKVEDQDIFISGQTANSETLKQLVLKLTRIQGVGTITSEVQIARPIANNRIGNI